MIKVSPVILCGGSGTRLWPLSRTGFPKQFLCLTGGESLFQQAAKRLVTLGNSEFEVTKPLIVTGEEHRFLALEQLREVNIDMGTILLEPAGRNTAPALTLAALSLMEEGLDPIMVVTPADQTVANGLAFKEAMHSAVHVAENGTIVVLGIKPSGPETGYGYIQVDSTDKKNQAQVVRSFVEKPREAAAKSYLEQGGYFWNAGMFVLRASVWLKTLEEFRPDILSATLCSWSKKTSSAPFVRPGKSEFEAIPSESIDYAAMENCPGSKYSIMMVPLDAEWNDLGDWGAVWKVLPKDNSGNVHIGDVLTTDSQNTLVHASSRLVSLVGLEGVIVIETADAVLVADKSRSQDIKSIVNSLSKQNRVEHKFHQTVHRPWGAYTVLGEGVDFKIKRIEIKPGASLSLQMHRHRSEHWVVVKGAAMVLNGECEMIINVNESTFIPAGHKHRLTNLGTASCVMIEVQSGEYVGEDDIVRFEDVYGRASGVT